MLCRTCRVHLRRDFPYCLRCGVPRRGVRLDAHVAPLLVPVEGPLEAPLPLTAAETRLGRAPDNDVVLDAPTVSRRHARLVRRDDGFHVEDLGSGHGTRVGSRRLGAGESALLLDGSVLTLGDVQLRFDQPRPAEVGGRTVYGAERTALRVDVPVGDAAPEAGEALSARPRLRSGWALKRVPGPDEAWVLSDREGAYLQLDEREVFVFRCVDGQSTVRDILFRYAEQFGELALPRIEAALRLFAAHGLVDGVGAAPPPRLRGWRRVGHAVYEALLKLEVTVPGLDRHVDRLYQRVGWRAFTRTGVLLTWLLVVGGLWAFVRAQDEQRLLDVGGAGWWGGAVVLVGYVVALALHETAHALAVKSYGRRVRRGGFLLMMGMPFAFVDTSDMWFGTRWSRVVVALSGPLSTAALAGVLAVGADVLPGEVAPALCFQLAFGLYLNTVYNFNPIMPLDGYQALTDAFRIPRLREEASAYFTRGVWRDLAARRRPGVRQLGLALYGLAVVVGGWLFLVLALVAWQHRLGPFVDEHVPAPFDTLVLLAGIVLVTFPVWARLGGRLRRLVRERLAARPAPEPVAVPA